MTGGVDGSLRVAGATALGSATQHPQGHSTVNPFFKFAAQHPRVVQELSSEDALQARGSPQQNEPRQSGASSDGLQQTHPESVSWPQAQQSTTTSSGWRINPKTQISLQATMKFIRRKYRTVRGKRKAE